MQDVKAELVLKVFFNMEFAQFAYALIYHVEAGPQLE